MRQAVRRKIAAPRLLVIQPDLAGPLDRFAERLADAGLEVRVVRPFAGEPLPRRLTDDGMIVLGGDMSANDDVLHPWLIEIRHLLREAVELGRPTLGVCLGGQLLARATGGSVVRGDKGIEAGVVRVVWTADAESDALTAGLPQPFPIGCMHEDMIDRLPEGATWIGRSDLYQHQAFRVGSRAWGVQFHPEASAASYRRWVTNFQGNDARDLERIHSGIDDFEKLDDEVLQGTSELARRFAEMVWESARQRRHQDTHARVSSVQGRAPRRGG